MNWLDDYKKKLCSAESAVKCIKAGDRVNVHPGCAVPKNLLKAMVKRKDELFSVEVVHMLTFDDAEYVKPGMEDHFRHNAFFAGPNVRKEVNDCKADWIPIFLSDIEGLFSTVLPVDVNLIQLSPPDEHGFCSFGVGVDTTKTAASLAKINVAQINPRMPRTLGDSFIHINKLHHIVEVDEPLAEQPKHETTDIQKQIGKNISNLIEDGSTLQMGIGGIPDGVLSYLGDRKDLGIHTELFSDNVISLVEKGVINGSRKTIHNGKVIAAFLLGSKPLFDFVHNNPIVDMHTTRYVNDPCLIAQNFRMVAINSALQMDLTGQVCSDSIGHCVYSGVGGQVDFIRGSARSKGGKPIIALASTAKERCGPRITPFLDHGAGVVTSRADVHWVVTEYGAVNLHGMNIRQRAERLIGISHPKFREELTRGAYERKLLTRKSF